MVYLFCNADIFNQRRLIVVVTKLDEAKKSSGYHNDDEDELVDIKSVVEKICKYIQKVCGCSNERIPEDIVIPVFGKWADDARWLAKKPECKNRIDKVVEILSRSKWQPAGQGETPRSSLSKRSAEWLSEELLKITGIQELEKR